MSMGEWGETKISQFGAIITGSTPDTRNINYWGGDIPFVSPADFNSSAFVLKTDRTLTNQGAKQARVVPKNSILVTCIGSIGGIAIASWSCVTNQQINSVICGENFDARFVYFLIQNNLFRLKELAGITTLPIINKSTFGNIEIICPKSKSEQEQIAAILSTIDRAIEQTEDIIAKQQRIKTGLIQDLLTKGIDEDGNVRSEETHEFKDSPLGRIPVDWDVQLLDKLAERGSGHTPNKTHQEYWNGGIKWVSLADSSKLDNIYIFDTDKEISEQGLKNSSAVLHPKGTVIVSRDAGVGKSAILSTQMAVSQHFIVWRCSRNLNNYYLYYWLQKDKPKFEGIALGSTIVTIGLQFFREYLIAIPNLLDEQIFIAQIIKHSDECLCEHQHNLEKLKRQKTGLMQDLLTGNVRVIALLNDQNKTPIHETVTLK